MKFEDMTTAIVIAWALVWSVIALSLVSSVNSWFLLVGLGVLPPLMMLRMWNPPASAVPVSTHAARR